MFSSTRLFLYALILIQAVGACCCFLESDCCDDASSESDAVLVASIECQKACTERSICAPAVRVQTPSNTPADFAPIQAWPDVLANGTASSGRRMRLPDVEDAIQPLPLAGVAILRC